MSEDRREARRLVEEPDLEGDLRQVARLLSEVEPPAAPPAARARVWTRLAEPAPRRRGWVLAACVAAAALLAWMLLPKEAPVEVKPPSESVAMAPARPPVPAAPVVPEGRRVKTGPRRSSTLALGDLVEVDLEPTTELVAFEEELRIELIAGELLTRPTKAGVRVVVSTQPYRVTGEVVRVARRGAVLKVQAVAGEATVEGPAGRHRIAAGEARSFGERARIEDPVVEEAVAEAPRRRPARKARRRRRSSPKRARSHKTPLDRGPRRESRNEGGAQEPRPGRGSDPVHTPKPAGPKTPDLPVPAREAERPIPAREATPPIPAREATPPIPARETAPAPTSPDWAALYRQATREPDRLRAIALFDRIARSDSPWAEVSAYQAARLTKRRGRYAEAVRRFAPLLHGTYGLEAHLDTLECRLEMNDLEEAERVLDRILRRYPDNGRSTELRNLRDELARRRSKGAGKK